MNRTLIRAGVAALLALVASGGCVKEAPVDEEEWELEIYTYWTQDNAFADMLSTITEVFTAENPDVLLRNGSVHWTVREGNDYTSVVERRFEAGEPPDVYQANGLLKLSRAVERGMAEPIDELLAEKQFAFSREALTVQGRAYGAPINAIRDNMVFLNLQVLRDGGVTDAELATLHGKDASFADLFAAADKVAAYYQAEGAQGAPFGIFQGISDAKAANPDVRHPWTYKDLFMDCILPGTLGRARWQDLMDAPTVAKWKAAEVRLALMNLKLYVDRSNQDFLQDCEGCAEWDTILDGRSAMVALGDWYVALFRQGSKVYGQDWDAIACPGTSGAFLGHADFWLIGKDAPHPENARKFVEIATRPEVQLAFNAAFGALPAVKVDAKDLSDQNGFDGYSRATYADLQSSGFIWRTEHQTNGDFKYLSVLGPYADAVLGLDMATSRSEVEAAIDEAVDAFATMCSDLGSCK